MYSMIPRGLLQIGSSYAPRVGHVARPIRVGGRSEEGQGTSFHTVAMLFILYGFAPLLVHVARPGGFPVSM